MSKYDVLIISTVLQFNKRIIARILSIVEHVIALSSLCSIMFYTMENIQQYSCNSTIIYIALKRVQSRNSYILYVIQEMFISFMNYHRDCYWRNTKGVTSLQTETAFPSGVNPQCFCHIRVLLNLQSVMLYFLAQSAIFCVMFCSSICNLLCNVL